jgi:hypothetical protein
MEFRGLICNNDNDYRSKERMIQSHLEKFAGYTSEYFAGGLGKPDIYTVDGNPILVEPKNELWAAEMIKLPLNFETLDKSIIKQEL